MRMDSATSATMHYSEFETQSNITHSYGSQYYVHYLHNIEQGPVDRTCMGSVVVVQ